MENTFQWKTFLNLQWSNSIKFPKIYIASAMYSLTKMTFVQIYIYK